MIMLIEGWSWMIVVTKVMDGADDHDDDDGDGCR